MIALRIRTWWEDGVVVDNDETWCISAPLNASHLLIVQKNTVLPSFLIYLFLSFFQSIDYCINSMPSGFVQLLFSLISMVGLLLVGLRFGALLLRSRTLPSFSTFASALAVQHYNRSSSRRTCGKCPPFLSMFLCYEQLNYKYEWSVYLGVCLSWRLGLLFFLFDHIIAWISAISHHV